MSDVSSIKVTVIGCGYWGKNLVRNFADLGALAAICDNDPVAASELSKRHPVPVTSFADAISGGGAPAIVIATPAESHYTLAREALRAGKHVFVEKPLALEVGQAEDLCRIADEQRCTLMVGHLLQYHPAFLKLRNLVQEGALGRLQYIYSNRLNLGKVRREENILWSFAPHDISMILALVGAEPDHVEAKGAAYLHKIVSDITVTQMSFPAGEQAHVFVSWLHPSKEQKLVVIGDGGMAIFDDGRPWASKLRLFFHKIEWIDGRPEPSKVAPENVVVDEIEPLSLECRHFLECVETRQQPRTDGREGLRVLRVLEAAQRCVDGTPMGTAGTPQRGADSAWARYPEVSIHESAYVDEPAEIGVGTKIWHFSHVLSGTKIGRDCVIGQNAMLGPDVTIGDRCKIQNNVSIYKGVTLEDGVFCGPSCVFTNVHNPRAEVERKDEFQPTRVRKGVTIGANATILCGHELGEYAFIGAGALIAGDVPAHALMAGVPARRIGWMSHAGERLGEDLVCPRSGRRYREKGPEELEEIDDD